MTWHACIIEMLSIKCIIYALGEFKFSVSGFKYSLS